MEEWKEFNISDVIEEISMGPFGSNIKVDNFIDFGVPVLNGSNLQGFKLNEESFNYVSQEKADSLGKANAHRGDIVITHRGTLGQIVYIPENSKFEQYVISQSQFRLKLNQSLIRPDFFVYFFHTRLGQHRILMNASQVGVPALARPTSTFKKVNVPVPSIEIQNKVMAILNSIDDKIAVNRRICENLEAQAQALFKHWFIDFAPFKNGNFCANREQNETCFNSAEVQPKITGKACKFVESELGMIPEGWKVAKIKDIPHTLNTGKRPKGGAITSGVPSIGAEQLKGLCNYDYTKTKYISKEYSQTIPKGKVIGYEVYLNRVGGKPGDYIQNTTMFGEGYPYENCYLNDHVFKLDFMQNRGYNVYIYFTFLTSRIQKYLNACGGKAAIPVINKQNIDDIYVFLPENEYVTKFGESVLPMIKMIFKIGVESARLANLRDTLLPKLMSGQIKVNEMEKSL